MCKRPLIKHVAHVGGKLKTLYDTKQVAELLGFSETKIRIMSAAGKIPRLKIGRSVRYDPTKLEEWLTKFAEEAKLLPDEQDPLKTPRLGRRDPKRPVTFTLD